MTFYMQDAVGVAADGLFADDPLALLTPRPIVRSAIHSLMPDCATRVWYSFVSSMNHGDLVERRVGRMYLELRIVAQERIERGGADQLAQRHQRSLTDRRKGLSAQIRHRRA